MAKALLGHVRGPDQRVAAELRRLRQRVGDLEAQLARLQEEREALATASARSVTARSPRQSRSGRAPGGANRG